MVYGMDLSRVLTLRDAGLPPERDVCERRTVFDHLGNV
jgi:hypothetical protein